VLSGKALGSIKKTPLGIFSHAQQLLDRTELIDRYRERTHTWILEWQDAR